MTILKVIEACCEEVVGPLGRELTQECTLADLNFDSLDVVEFVLSLEEHYEIDITDGEAERRTNAQDIINYLKSRGCTDA